MHQILLCAQRINQERIITERPQGGGSGRCLGLLGNDIFHLAFHSVATLVGALAKSPSTTTWACLEH